MIKTNKITMEIPHPGVYIKEAIEELGISQYEFALRANMTPKVVSTLINGESNITFDVATSLASFFNSSIDVWISLQTEYERYLKRE